MGNNWKYFELIAIFYQAYFKLIAQGATSKEAINRIFEDFWFHPENENVLNNLIVLIQFIEMKFSMEKNISIELVNLFTKQLHRIKEIDVEKCLDKQEMEHFQESIDEVLFMINNMNKN